MPQSLTTIQYLRGSERQPLYHYASRRLQSSADHQIHLMTEGNGPVFNRKREKLQTIALATMTFFKKSQLFDLSGSQRRHYHVHPRSLQKTNVIIQPVSSPRTRCYRQTNSLYFYPKWIHKKTQRESGLSNYDASCE